MTEPPNPRTPVYKWSSTVPNCLSLFLKRLDADGKVSFPNGSVLVTSGRSAANAYVLVSPDAWDLLKRLNDQPDPEIAATWPSLRDACTSDATFEIEAELLLHAAIGITDASTDQPAIPAAEAVRQNKLARDAARRFAKALVKNDCADYPCGGLWELVDALKEHRLSECEKWRNSDPGPEEDLPSPSKPTILELMERRAKMPTLRQLRQQLMNGADDPEVEYQFSKSLLLRNSPSLLQLVEQFGDLEDELSRAPRHEYRPTRHRARVTRFRGEVLEHLLNQFDAKRARSDTALVTNLQKIAHGVTLAAFYKSPGEADGISLEAARMQLSRLLKENQSRSS